MARHLGIVDLGAEIRKIQPRDFTEKEWVGSFRQLNLEVLPVAGERAEVKTRRVPRYKLRLVAVAGAVAEECWQRATLDDVYEAFWCSPEIMSASDWKFSGCAPGEPSKQLLNAIEEVFNLLNRENGKLWRELLEVSRDLILDNRLLQESRRRLIRAIERMGSFGLSS
jgi:hypothetical protein